MIGRTTTFAYNGDGLRNSRTVGGNTTTFTWDVGPSIPQILDDGSFRYVYGLERIAEVGPGATTHYYLPDGLGSTMALVDSAGAIVSTYHYDVFGAIRSSTGSQANEFKFTGEQVDSSTGLEYLRARYYDQATGRFLSKDPLALKPQWPGQPYAYSESNPTSFTDPLGLAAKGKNDRGRGAEEEKCSKGWDNCSKGLLNQVNKNLKSMKKKPLKPSEVARICLDVFNRCLESVKRGGKGDFDDTDAASRMYWLRFQTGNFPIEWLNNIWRIIPPGLGSGGLVPQRPAKEGSTLDTCS